MTEHINLETTDAYLASVVLSQQGNLLPSPLIILSDKTPLYDEPGFIEEMETALAEGRAAKIEAEISNIETYNSNLITITFGSEKFTNTYHVNIPRQLMQVGYMYDRLLNAPACGLLTEAEQHMNKDFTNENVSGEFLPPLMSEDIMIYLTFPKELTKDQKNEYNLVLNNLPEDVAAGVTKEDLRKIAPKMRLTVGEAESLRVRGEIIEMFLGLVEGKEDALVELYEWAEHVDTAKQAMEKNALLTEDERKSVIAFGFVAGLAGFLTPENLINNIKEINKAIEAHERYHDTVDKAVAPVDEPEVKVDLDDLFSDEFKSSLDEIITEFRQKNPDVVTINEDSTHAERVEYLSLASNLVPLMGGLVTLSDRINVDHYYSYDWNNPDVTEEEYGTRGEYFIILSILAVQRMYMFGKCIDAPEGVQEAKTLALSLLIEALTQDSDLEMWFLKEALNRASGGDEHALLQYLIMSLSETPQEYQAHGPFGQILHWLGHVVVEDKHEKTEMMKLFNPLPSIAEFMTVVFNTAEGMNEDSDEEDEDDVCFVTEATLELPFTDEPNIPLAEEATKALVLFAEYCLLKDHQDIEKGTAEWKETLRTYLTRLIDED